MTLKPIGFILSPFKQKFGTPRQSGLVPSAKAIIQLDNKRVAFGALDGLDSFNYVWIIFYFHKNAAFNTKAKVQPPRLNGKKIGLFATRSPHRPNPIGMSLVKLESISEQNHQIVVSGADLVDGTPVLDIKPYLKDFDSRQDSGGNWTQNIESQTITVCWDLTEPIDLDKNVKNLFEESLSHDIRNLGDKEKNDFKKIHKCYLGDYDIHFYYKDQTVTIKSVLKR